MLYPSIDKLLEVVPSKYLLINLVSKRVADTKENKNYLLDRYVSKRELGMALEEIYNGKVRGDFNEK